MLEELLTFSNEKIEDVLGKTVKGSYSEDLDIINIHLAIKNKFNWYHQEKEKHAKILKEYDKKIANPNFSLIEKTKFIFEKDKLYILFEKYSQQNWDIYTQKIKDILQSYLLLSKKKKKTLIIKGKDTDFNPNKNVDFLEEQNQRLAIIRRFLEIAKNYIEIDIVFKPNYKAGCDECNLNLEEMGIDEEKGYYICDCNNIFGNVYSSETPHLDPERIEAPVKATYDDLINFKRRLKSYQGYQSKKLNTEFIDFLDKHMQDKYHLPPAEEIKKMELNEYGHRCPQTSVYLLKETLRETNNSIHFQDINSICYELWGWEPPKIKHLEPKIIDDYVKTQEVYRELNQTDSSINVDLRLYWHLMAVGHKCLLDDFKIPQSPESKKRNSFIFKKMCEKTGLTFHPIIF